MNTVPIKVSIVNIEEHDRYLEDSNNPAPCIFFGTGVYYGCGRMVFTAVVPEGKVEYEIDPERFHPDDPKRCIRVDSNKWSKYRLRSCVMDSKAFLKPEKSVKNARVKKPKTVVQ